MVSGSSVTSGRCCAAAGAASPSTSRSIANAFFINGPRGIVAGFSARPAASAPPHRRGLSLTMWACSGTGCSRRSSRWRVPTLARARIIEFLMSGMLDLELGDEPLDALALQAEIAARRAAAADDRQRRRLGVVARLGLGDADERTNDDVLAVVGHEPRRHRLERAGKEEVEQQRLDEIVEVVTERDLAWRRLRSRAGRARRGESARTASTAWHRRRGGPRSSRRFPCGRCGIPSRAPRRSSR